MNTESRAIDAERVLERNRRDVAALCTTIAAREHHDQFPRSATLRWLLRNVKLRLNGPLAMTLAASLARVLIRRHFARKG